MAESVDQDVREAADQFWDAEFACTLKTPDDLYRLLARMKAAGRVQGVMEVITRIRDRIGEGYPVPPNKVDQCEHGRFGWEDCIACYDEAIESDLTAIEALLSEKPA